MSTTTPLTRTDPAQGFGSAGPSIVAEQPHHAWTRRTFLATLSALTVATVSGCGIAGSDELDLADAMPSHPQPRPTQGLPGTGGAAYTPATPYALTATSELSEDYFLVQNHRINPAKDKVSAYTRTNGQVEAIVLQDGFVKQVYRDPTQSGGWAVYALPDAAGVTDMVAGATQPTRAAPYLMVCYRTASHPDQLVVATQSIAPVTAQGPSFTTTTVPWHPKAMSLRVSSAPTNFLLNKDDVLVWAMVPSSESGQGDAQVCWQLGGGSSGTLAGFDYDPWDNGLPCLTIASSDHVIGTQTPSFFLYLPQAEDAMQIWYRTSTTSGQLQRLDQGRLAVQLPQPPPGGLVVTNVVYATQQIELELPTALVWTQRSIDGGVAGNPQLWALTYHSATSLWVWTNLGVPQDLPHDFEIPVTAGITPRSSDGGFLLDVFVCWGGKLSVARQLELGTTADLKAPAFTPMIALQGDVATMTSQAGASAGNQLIVVEGDGTLHTLEKDATGGWSDNVIRVPGSEMQQDSSYRVTLTLADIAWNMPVTSHDLNITASFDAVAVIEGPAPRTVRLGSAPITVATDTSGEVTLALLADGLSAPTLTVASSGLPKAATVYPSAAVNAYLQGGGKLNYLDPMSVGTLTTATAPDKHLVAPDAAKDPDQTQLQVDTMRKAATWGAQGSADGALSSTRTRIDGRPAQRPRRRRRGKHAKLSATALSSNIDNWAHDVCHAIKKGATAVEKVTVDAEHRIVTIAVDAAGWAENTVQIVVRTIEDAAQVLHAAFNKLGADIMRAVKWLEAEVLGVLTAAKALSDKFETWTGDFCGFAATTLGAEQTKAVNWLEREQTSVNDRLSSLAKRFSSKTTLSTMAKDPPSPPTEPRASRRRLKATANLQDDEDQQPAHGDWFYRKIKHELLGSGLKIDLSKLPDLKDKVIAFCEKSLAHCTGFQDRFRIDFWMGFINDVVKHPDDVADIAVQALLVALTKVVNDAFDFAENIVAEAFELLAEIASSIPALLSGTTLKNLPILGGLMTLIHLGDVSIGRVANLIFAFPCALVYKIAHGAEAQPFASKPALRRSARRLGDEASDLQICAASVLGTWAVFDTASAAFVAGDEDGGILFTAVDIAAPLIATILTTPATQDGEPFFAPPVSGKDSDVMGFIAWFFGAVPALCAALPEIFERTVPDDAAKRERYVQVTLWVETLTGVLALIFGMIANSEKDTPKGADYAGAVLNNMPTIAGAGLTDVIKEATVGVSVVVSMALVLVCGELGAAVYGADG